MRSPKAGVISGASELVEEKLALDIFDRMCRARHFDACCAEASKDGLVTYQIYLSLGQEAVSAAISAAIPDYQIFAQHRCHDTYLSYGGDPVKIRDELLGLQSGSSGGRAGSNCLQCFDNGIEMFGHHGLIGENVPLAVGAALGNGKPTVCFFGDGAAEEDYVFSAMGFAATHKLPVLFVVVDNDLSILTKVETRRSWSISEVAKGFGLNAIDVSDDPWSLYLKTKELSDQMPALMNVYTCRSNWHVGVGTDGPPEWDRYDLVKNDLKNRGLENAVAKIEEKNKSFMEDLWNRKHLEPLLKK